MTEPESPVTARSGSGLFGKLHSIAGKLRAQVMLYRAILRHPRTPLLPRVLLGLAIGYFLLPFDLIPDFIPVIGHLDDALIVPFLVWVAIQLIPADIVEECSAHLAHGTDSAC